MRWRARWRRWKQAPGSRHAIAATGWVLILLAPAVGLLPGPGGVFVLAAGLALVLQTSAWAKRAYVRVKRRWPRAGSLADRAMRRPSERRRRERRKLVTAGAAD